MNFIKNRRLCDIALGFFVGALVGVGGTNLLRKQSAQQPQEIQPPQIKKENKYNPKSDRIVNLPAEAVCRGDLVFDKQGKYLGFIEYNDPWRNQVARSGNPLHYDAYEQAHGGSDPSYLLFREDIQNFFKRHKN